MLKVIRKFLQKKFKLFFYSFFSIIYGKIEKIIRIDNDERIIVKNINLEENLNYSIYKIIEGRLYTDRIHDTAVILDNKIIEGPSFQLRNNINSNINDNIVFEKGTPRLLKKLNGSVLSLLTGGAGNENYWHWMYDVLPRIKLCEKVTSLKSIDYFLLPNLKKKFQIETLELLNIPKKKLLSSESFRHIKTKQLFVTAHPYAITKDPVVNVDKMPKWIAEWLKEKFLSSLKGEKKDYPKNIYIDRSDSTSNVAHMRLIVNEKELIQFLRRKNFEILRLNDLDFIEQVKYFNNADCIVGLHGAGFANLTFCKSNTRVIEFKTSNTGRMYEKLAQLNELKYTSIVSEAISHAYAKQLGHIKIPLNILEKFI